MTTAGDATKNTKSKKDKSLEDLLFQIVVRSAELDWNDISKRVGIKSPDEAKRIYERIIGTETHNTWKKSEKDELWAYVRQGKKLNNEEIGLHFPGRTLKAVRVQYLKYKTKLEASPKFTSYEDRILLDMYTKYGDQWEKIAKFLPGRKPFEIRSRIDEIQSVHYLENEKPPNIVQI